jgi:hypothetical protein
MQPNIPTEGEVTAYALHIIQVAIPYLMASVLISCVARFFAFFTRNSDLNAFFSRFDDMSIAEAMLVYTMLGPIFIVIALFLIVSAALDFAHDRFKHHEKRKNDEIGKPKRGLVIGSDGEFFYPNEEQSHED